MRTPSIRKDDSLTELTNVTHFNLQKLCAIDIITTGPDPKQNEILEICIFPLNSHYNIAETILPFNATFKPMKHWLWMNPEYIKEYKISKKRNEIAYSDGIDKSDLVDLFINWFDSKLKPVEGKKIMPLAYDWASKKPFLVKWLGQKNYDYYFHWQYRDILSMALFCNDFSDVHCEPYRLSKVDFRYICSSLRIETDSFDTIVRCHSIAKIYELFLYSFYNQMVIR